MKPVRMGFPNIQIKSTFAFEFFLMDSGVDTQTFISDRSQFIKLNFINFNSKGFKTATNYIEHTVGTVEAMLKAIDIKVSVQSLLERCRASIKLFI